MTSPRATGGRRSLDDLARALPTPTVPPTADLEGMDITTRTVDGTLIRHRFEDGGVTWRYVQLRSDVDTRGTNPYEAFRVDDGLYFVQFQRDDRPVEATSLVLDLDRGRTLAVTSTIRPTTPSEPAVGQVVRVSDLPRQTTHGPFIAPSPHPVGTLVLPDAAARGAAALDFLLTPASADRGPGAGPFRRRERSSWSIRDGIHVVAVRCRETASSSVAVVDHRDVDRCRVGGVLFGLGGAGTAVVHTTFSARGRFAPDG